MTALDIIQKYPSIRVFYGSGGQLCCNIYGKRYSLHRLAENIHHSLPETKSLLNDIAGIQHNKIKINMEF